MAVFLALLLYLIILSASTEGSSNDIKERIDQIQFDSKGNSYAVLYQDGTINKDRLYKLNSTREIVLVIDYYHIWKILINNQDELYMFVSDLIDHALGKQSLFRLKPNSNKTDFLFNFSSKGKYHDPGYMIDKDGYIFFNTDSGVAVLKPNKNQPVWVANLEKLSFFEHAEDKDGSVYLRGENLVAVITQESKQSISVVGKFISSDRYADIKKKQEPEKKVISETAEETSSESGLSTWQIVFIAIGVLVFLALLVVTKGEILLCFVCGD